MKILEYLKQGPCICITENAYKKHILEELEHDFKFYHIQFLTKEELQKQLLFEYRPEALWKFSKQFHLIPENGKIVLESLYAIEEKENFPELYAQKEWLLKENLLVKHPLFLKQLLNKKVIVYGYDFYEMKFLDSILKKYCKVEYVSEEFGTYQPLVTEYETLEQEVVGTAEKISKLLAAGISIEHIFLGKLNNDYQSVMSKVFYQFHIPFVSQKSHVLFEYEIVQSFIKMIDWNQSLDALPSLLEELEKKYPKTNSFYQSIYDSFINIFNVYYSKGRTFGEIKDILLYELKHTTVLKETYQNVLREVDFEKTLFGPDDYIFLMGVNLGEFPRVYEDSDYFTDIEKERLFLPTSLEMTVGEEQKIKRKIESLPHVFLSYKKKSPFKEYLPSPLLEKMTDIVVAKGEYTYSNAQYNEYLLNSSLDGFINFNDKNEHLTKLYGLENLYYQSYDNQFTGIAPSEFRKRVSSCLLSYTGMQKFFECPFKYYVQNILKIMVPFTETPSLIIGNVFHSILEQYFKNKNEVDEIIDREMENIPIYPEQKREFYVQKYKVEIKRLIAIMEEQLGRSSFTPSYFEETIEYSEKKSILFRIFGKIDKIMTFEDENNSYVIVIDYKTGVATSNLSKVIYGMNMQLLLYLYLISKDKRFKNYVLSGAYIQSISPSIPNYTDGKSVEDLLWEQSKLDGISLKRTDFMGMLDHDYQCSSYIKGVRVKSDGEFYVSNRLLESSTLDALLEIVERNIEEVEKTIEEANFMIHPKKFTSEIGDQVSSCAYCHYRDICYLKAKNVITLKEYKNLEFLEGSEEL